MRKAIMIVAACVALVAAAFPASKPAEAASKQGTYCLEYNEGGNDCSFTSLAQCNASASGINGACDAVPSQAAMQEPGLYAFYHPDAGLGVEAARRPDAAMAAMAMRRHVARGHRNGRGT